MLYSIGSVCLSLVFGRLMMLRSMALTFMLTASGFTFAQDKQLIMPSPTPDQGYGIDHYQAGAEITPSIMISGDGAIIGPVTIEGAKGILLEVPVGNCYGSPKVCDPYNKSK